MEKINRSITISDQIAKAADDQAAKEMRSFSSFIEYVIVKYLESVKTTKSKK
jgi:hypothetical protein